MFKLWKQPQWPKISFDEIRKRARLVVIDDGEFPYEKLFHRDGYTLDKWNDVTNLSDLENGKFDIILLDLQGVGLNESLDQGFGILKYLRERCPAQIIVAYSNADWGLRYHDFFRLADATLPKTADYISFRDRVDELLKQRFSLGFYVDKIVDAADAYEVDSKRLEEASRQAILNRDTSKLKAFLAKTSVPIATIDRVIALANVAVGVMQLWTV